MHHCGLSNIIISHTVFPSAQISGEKDIKRADTRCHLQDTPFPSDCQLLVASSLCYLLFFLNSNNSLKLLFLLSTFHNNFEARKIYFKVKESSIYCVKKNLFQTSGKGRLACVEYVFLYIIHCVISCTYLSL